MKHPTFLKNKNLRRLKKSRFLPSSNPSNPNFQKNNKDITRIITIPCTIHQPDFPRPPDIVPQTLVTQQKQSANPSNPILPQSKQGLRNLLLSLLLLHRNPASFHSRWATYVRRHIGREKRRGKRKGGSSHRSSSQNSIFGCDDRQVGSMKRGDERGDISKLEGRGEMRGQRLVKKGRERENGRGSREKERERAPL